MSENMIAFQNPDVMEKFRCYPLDVAGQLLSLRQLIFDVGAKYPEIGKIDETLKWNEPSYNNPKTGSAIRIDWKKSTPDCYMVYFNCKTTLVEEFRSIYANIFRYHGNRAIIFGKTEEINIEALKHCFYLSLTYKLRKR